MTIYTAFLLVSIVSGAININSQIRLFATYARIA